MYLSSLHSFRFLRQTDWKMADRKTHSFDIWDIQHLLYTRSEKQLQSQGFDRCFENEATVCFQISVGFFFSVSYTSWLENSKNHHFLKHFNLNTSGNISTPFFLPVLTNGKVSCVTPNALLFAKTLLYPEGLPQNQNMGSFKVHVIFSKVVRPVLP